jgi:RNA polymerase sigma factor (sigma-70 family)
MHETDRDYLPCAHTERKEQSREIFEVLKKLPDSSRKMIVLYYNDGMCYKDIADHLGVSVNSVSVNMFRAKKRLLKEMPRSLRKC